MSKALSEADWWKEDQISNLEDKVSDNTKSEKQKVKINEGSLKDLWDDIKHNNIHIIGLPEERKTRDLEHIWKSYEWKLPYADERNRFPSAGGAEDLNKII